MIVLLAATAAKAQLRYSCTPHLLEPQTRSSYHSLVYPSQDWDAHKTYRQLVVLISFEDCDFSMSDPKAFYQRLFNEKGFNQGVGPGCVADYFRDQSGGLFNLQFDIYGPFQVDTLVKKAGAYGDYAIRRATQMLVGTPGIDYTPYDWNGDGEVEQVIYIAAGLTGNEATGYLWPNTYWISTVSTPDNHQISTYSISCELWKNNTSCGIGTICHEYAHCLGLPDIYPSSGNLFSVVDDWDLMDGGNYIGYGWCPPNFSALEKMLMGWAKPTELSSATTIADMKSVSDNGATYLVRNTGAENEYYLLENRQQKGWDYGIPGNGLLIIHVDYDRDVWADNVVNTNSSHLRYDLFHADGRDYLSWDPNNNGKDMSKYTMEGRLRNRYLSTSVYPYYDEESLVENRSLTDETSPAATLFHANADGRNFMSKAITNIQMASDGSVSFDFMKGSTAISDVLNDSESAPVVWYDLNGRRLSSEPSKHGIYIIRYGNGIIKKSIR